MSCNSTEFPHFFLLTALFHLTCPLKSTCNNSPTTGTLLWFPWNTLRIYLNILATDWRGNAENWEKEERYAHNAG